MRRPCVGAIRVAAAVLDADAFVDESATVMAIEDLVPAECEPCFAVTKFGQTATRRSAVTLIS
jgi:hypothetical protein